MIVVSAASKVRIKIVLCFPAISIDLRCNFLTSIQVFFSVVPLSRIVLLKARRAYVSGLRTSRVHIFRVTNIVKLVFKILCRAVSTPYFFLSIQLRTAETKEERNVMEHSVKR